jgi:hypothetical protein
MHLIDGSRVRSRSREAFTGLEAERSRHNAGCVGRCEGIRKPAQPRGATGMTLDRSAMVAVEQQATAIEAKKQTSTLQSHLGGVKPLGARSHTRQGGRGGRNRKIPFVRGVTSSRANEARVLEIEAADGRNRSYASRVGHGQRRKARLESHTLALASTGNTALMRPVAKARVKWCAKRLCVQHRMHGAPGRMRKQAVIRHGGRRPESRLHHPFTGVVKVRLWQCGSSPATSSKGGGVGASGGVRKHPLDESSVERPAALAGREVARQRVRISSRRMVPLSRVPTGDRGRQRSADLRGEGSPSGNNARRVSVANIERCASNGSSGSVTRARVWSMGSAVTPIHGEAGHASRSVVPKLAGLTTTPILPGPRDANHAGSVCHRPKNGGA